MLGADVVASLAGAREEVLKEMVHNGYLAESADGDESRVGTIDPSDGFLSTGRPQTFADTAGESGGLTEVFSGGYVSDSCGRYLQALAVTDVEISEYGPMGLAISIGEGVPLSVFHERRVGELLAAACEAILGGFATTSQHDEALLEADGSGSELAPRARQAIRSRLARKRALTEILERARQWVEQPTAAGGTLRRPWRVHVRTSG